MSAPSTFQDRIGFENSSLIIKKRIFTLSEEGFQHELNAKYINYRLKEDDLDAEEKDSLTNQLFETLGRMSDLERTINWHEMTLLSLDSFNDVEYTNEQGD